MYVCIWSPVREVCPNYEVVVFRPRTVTPPQLGSVEIVTLKLSLPPHLFLLFVWVFLLSPHSYCSPICSRSSSNSSLVCTRSPPPLPERSAAHLDVNCTRHPPASAACLCALHHVPVSATVTVTVRSPILCPWPTHRSMLAPGGISRRGYLRASVPPPCPPRVLLQILALSGPRSLVGWIFAGGQEARTPPLSGSLSPWPSLPTIIGHTGAVQAIRLPPRKH